MTEPAGVNLVGLAGGEQVEGPSAHLGLGEIARRVAVGLEHAGIPHALVPYGPDVASGGPPWPQAVYDTNLLCLNADSLGGFVAHAGTDFFRGRRSIGFWFWETSRFRLDDAVPLAFLDEIWVASSFVRDAVAVAVDVPVLVAPLPAERRDAPTADRATLGLPGGFLFLFVFDFVSGGRKNPMATLRAFTEAFAPGEGPRLVLKSVNGRERKPQLLAELERAAAERPDVLVRDGLASPEENLATIASCDCYVSLHRSEGLGLTMVEALEFGRPVVATAYSGNLEFMSADSSYLVPFEQAPVPSDWWASTPGAEWAEPDVTAAAELMRRVWDDPGDARARGERARDELLARFGVDRAAGFMADRLDVLRLRGPRRAAHARVLEASGMLLGEVGGSLAAEGRGTSRLRRSLRRALWPQLEEQRRLDSAMLDGLVALQRSVDELELRVRRLETAASATDVTSVDGDEEAARRIGGGGVRTR